MSSNWESNLLLNLVLCTLLSKWTPSTDNCEVITWTSEFLQLLSGEFPQWMPPPHQKLLLAIFFHSRKKFLVAVYWLQINVICLDSSCVRHLGRSCPHSVLLHEDSYLPTSLHIYVLFDRVETTERDVTDLFHYQQNHRRRSKLCFQRLMNERNNVTLLINNFSGH